MTIHLTFMNTKQKLNHKLNVFYLQAILLSPELTANASTLVSKNKRRILKR